MLPLFGDRKPFLYLGTDFNENSGKLSPNGRWLAYVSDETGRNEIYVQSFPRPQAKWQISTKGGGIPRWSRDGSELFYIAADNKMMAIDVKTGPQFQPGVPKPLFETHLGGLNPWFDVNQNGRFLMPVSVEQNASSTMLAVINWQATLRK